MTLRAKRGTYTGQQVAGILVRLSPEDKARFVEAARAQNITLQELGKRIILGYLGEVLSRG